MISADGDRALNLATVDVTDLRCHRERGAKATLLGEGLNERTCVWRWIRGDPCRCSRCTLEIHATTARGGRLSACRYHAQRHIHTNARIELLTTHDHALTLRIQIPGLHHRDSLPVLTNFRFARSSRQSRRREQSSHYGNENCGEN